jgi:hypothetical protein
MQSSPISKTAGKIARGLFPVCLDYIIFLDRIAALGNPTLAMIGKLDKDALSFRFMRRL